MKNDLIHFKVSVIIPVYNAGPYVQNAVLSAVGLKEVGEVILIEDNSPDNALDICRQLEKEYSKIKLLRHPGGVNKGISYSRNLGIKSASYPYVAFLDADDWYLPERFEKDAVAFNESPDADAVYSFRVLEENLENPKKNRNIEPDIREQIGDANILEFYRYAIENTYPSFHTNSITFKKEFLLNGRLFDERLRIHEDSELWKRLMRRGNFIPGQIKHPVAVIRRHDKNTITSRTLNSRLKMHAVFIDNIGIHNLYDFEKNQIIKDILRTRSKSYKNNWIRRLRFHSRLIKVKLNKDRFLQQFVLEYLTLSA